ncbi:hypothetical protein BN1222_03589 [Klebsiella quasipneumoniae]|uniref:hypothetical protein n=1 Tax=Klebsiella quasipneumoniae TaxID=1463165 RepID=UPI0005E46DE5|nr:hypothetical protein [Klebsiella quasipneumoniae]CEL82327.1 hypothetical protein BN1222_03589 [Klebsiella quasipneumoniae]
MSMDNNAVAEVMEIDTKELSAMFADGFEGEDITPMKEKIEMGDNMDGLEFTEEFDDEGNPFQYDPEDSEYDNDDIVDDSDYRDASEFDDSKLYRIGDENFEVGQIEKAVGAYKDIERYYSEIENHRTGLNEAEEQINKLAYLAHGQIDKTIEYYTDIMDNPRTSDADYRIALTELRNAEAAKKAIEAEYVESQRVMNARKQEAEGLKAITIRNELVHKHGWKQEDMQAVAEYMGSNGIVVKADAVNTNLMLALRKAASFDAQRNKAKVDADEKVVTALRGKGITKVKVAPEKSIDEAGRRKAEAKYRNGDIKHDEMFNYLVD